MRVFVQIIGRLALFLLTGVCFAQQPARPYKSFDVIIGISAANGEATAHEIKLLLSDSAHLSFQGYCANQQCVILRASAASFSSAQAVSDYLKNLYPDRVLGYKDYSVSEFFKQCTFPDPAEYQYFKQTYGK